MPAMYLFHRPRLPTPAPPPRQHQGQTLPLVLVFMLVLCIGLLVTFNTGQVVSKKVELTNTADAAAYSVAVEAARARNLAAYLNRGRVANEVAIAQFVSLNSWLTMVHSTTYHFKQFMDIVAPALSWVPGLGQVLVAIDRALAVLNQALNGFRKTFIPTTNMTIGGLDKGNFAYATAAEHVLGRLATGANVKKIVDYVVEGNSPQSKLTEAGFSALVVGVSNAHKQLNYFKPGRKQGLYSYNDGGDRYRNVVMASRDEFTRGRYASAFFGTLTANGGTDMVEYDRWSAVDTFQFRFRIPFGKRIKFPLGWGGTQGTDDGQPSFYPGIGQGQGWYSPYDGRVYQPYNGTSRYSISGRFIESDPAGQEMGFEKSKAYLDGYKYGISHHYYDTKRSRRDGQGYSETPESNDPNHPEHAGPIFTVEVGTDIAQVRTSSVVGIGVGRMQLEDRAKGGRLRAMASAQVYFARPQHLPQFRRIIWGRTDHSFEQGSMFSPYWQARLVKTPNRDRLMLVAGQ